MSQVDSGQKFLVCCVIPFYGKNALRIIRIQMGNQNGDGMDGGKFGNQNWGGGRFSFKLCFQGTVLYIQEVPTFRDFWYQKGITKLGDPEM